MRRTKERTSAERLLPLLPGLLLLTGALSARPAAIGGPEDHPAHPDPDRLHFHLITVAPGDRVWDNFGHTALRVRDELAGVDLVYNWGVFDFRDGLAPMAWDFFRGETLYRMAAGPPGREFAAYRAQRRSVRQDRINLTAAQKTALHRRLQWNREPENLAYAYHHFFDNCTTRVRDYLDEALGGRLERAGGGLAPHAYRGHIREHYRSAAPVFLFLDLMLNGNVDRPVSEWEEMYLPARLRERLAATPSDVTADGETLMLLSEPELVAEFPAPPRDPDPWRTAMILLLLPGLALALALRRPPADRFGAPARFRLRAPALSVRALGLLALAPAAGGGLLGALMLGGWLVSANPDLHRNLNLLLFWPTDLLGAAPALHWLLRGRPWRMSRRGGPWIRRYLLAHALAMLAYGGIAASGLAAQSIAAPAVHALPGLLLLTGLMWLAGFEPERSAGRPLFS